MLQCSLIKVSKRNFNSVLNDTVFAEPSEYLSNRLHLSSVLLRPGADMQAYFDSIFLTVYCML